MQRLLYCWICRNIANYICNISYTAANTHAQCLNKKCTVVPGNGSSQCTTDADCSSIQPNLSVAQNTAFTSQTISPNTSGVKIGSFFIQNISKVESVRLTSLILNGNVLDISALRTSDTTNTTPIGVPTGNDVFSVNDTLAPGALMTLR